MMFQEPITATCHGADRPALRTPLSPGQDHAEQVGACQVFPNTRTLLRQGREVEIGSRAFDLLMVLLRGRGTIVAKKDILAQVWPTTVVEEGNLRFQMVALRRALGPDHALIKTVHGRGYVLVHESGPGPATPAPSLATGAHAWAQPVVLVVEHFRVARGRVPASGPWGFVAGTR